MTTQPAPKQRPSAREVEIVGPELAGRDLAALVGRLLAESPDSDDTEEVTQ